jgi:hypothetical protein
MFGLGDARLQKHGVATPGLLLWTAQAFLEMDDPRGDGLSVADAAESTPGYSRQRL